jgi:hypothetical protein
MTKRKNNHEFCSLFQLENFIEFSVAMLQTEDSNSSSSNIKHMLLLIRDYGNAACLRNEKF